MPLPLLAGIPIAAQALFGAWQTLNAVKQAKKNVRTTYEIDPTFQYNIDLLKNSMGLPQSALEMLYNRNGQATSQGINAILSSGGNANQIAGLVGNQYAANQNIGIQDALQRKQDISGIMNAQLQLAGERDKAFQLNQYAPFADRAQALASQKNAGITNLGGAFNSASGLFAANATNNLANSLMNMRMEGFKIGGNTESNTTTTNSGVNTNKIYQELFGMNKPQSPFFNPNNLTLSNIPQAPPINLPQNPYQQVNWGMQQQPNLSMFNPNQLSLYNLQNYNPYAFNF